MANPPERIDMPEFAQIWDTHARLVNTEELRGLLETHRHPLVWDCLPEVGVKLSSLAVIRNPQIAKADAGIGASIEEEISFGVGSGYALRLAESCVTSGSPVDTRHAQLDPGGFVQQVFDWPSRITHSPLEVSLCEYHSQVAMKWFTEKHPQLDQEVVAQVKDEVFTAALYGFAAALIEEGGR